MSEANPKVPDLGVPIKEHTEKKSANPEVRATMKTVADTTRSPEPQMSARKKVTDWATDFDFLDPDWVENPYPIWNKLRSKCPIAHTDRHMGVYLPTRYADVREIPLDWEHFSTRRALLRDDRSPVEPAPPLTSDPPTHQPQRNVLLPFFTREAITRYEPRGRCIIGSRTVLCHDALEVLSQIMRKKSIP